MSNELPPLPHPVTHILLGDDSEDVFTADQMHAYARAAVLQERERICAAIKAEDDYCVTQGDYMLDSDDCIKVARGQWIRPEYSIAERSTK